MDNMINLIPAGRFDGVTGFMDYSNQMYMIQAKISWRATPEENRRLEEEMYSVYMGYLQRISNRNNGFY